MTDPLIKATREGDTLRLTINVTDFNNWHARPSMRTAGQTTVPVPASWVLAIIQYQLGDEYEFKEKSWSHLRGSVWCLRSIDSGNEWYIKAEQAGTLNATGTVVLDPAFGTSLEAIRGAWENGFCSRGELAAMVRDHVENVFMSVPEDVRGFVRQSVIERLNAKEE